MVEAGPDNPLGDHALYLDLPGYRIHGTNRPYGVGMRVTHGCVRMYPEDIELLFGEVRVGILPEVEEFLVIGNGLLPISKAFIDLPQHVKCFGVNHIRVYQSHEGCCFFVYVTGLFQFS